MKTTSLIKLTRQLLLTAALSVAAFCVQAYDFPHSPNVNNIICFSCHDLGSSFDKLLRVDNPHPPQDIDDTEFNNLCWSCHNDVVAPSMQTHSSLTTDNGYGDWAMECRDCHNPHSQAQTGYGSPAYLATGTVTAITATSLTSSGAGWAADEFAGMVMFPNTPNRRSYKITSNTSDTLSLEGPVDLAWATVGNSYGIVYGKLIKHEIQTPNSGLKPVRFFRPTGANSFADGDASYDGVCEVCHTLTNHFRNDGSAPDQTHDNVGGAAGQQCTGACHLHSGGFAHGKGGSGIGCIECHGHEAGTLYDVDATAPYTAGTDPSQGKGTVKPHSTHTESFVGIMPATAGDDDQRGPGLYCDSCHDTTAFPTFKSGTDSNGDGKYSLAETDVCDACHSPGGSYDGIDDPVIGAKNNWRTDGVYEADGSLKAGKEKWCAGCHDESPAITQSVSAPNVIGDEDGAFAYGIGWGYYRTGHGLATGAYPASEALAANKACTACHDTTVAHIDGEHRTYAAASDNYQAGYRLKLGMDIPRTDQGEPNSDFALCFSCHDSHLYLDEASFETNFRQDVTTNAHARHLQSPPTGPFAGSDWWDSDWDGVTGDSKISCPACHNVHGSPSPRMMRHGELISTPGTTDKVPSLNFQYTPIGSYATLMTSTGGSLYSANPGGGSIANTGVCGMCHSNRTSYTRTPNDIYPPAINGVYGQVGSDILVVDYLESVYTNTGATGDLLASDFSLVDADNGRVITGVTHSAGDDIAFITLSSALDATDEIGVDTLAAATATSIYDAWDNATPTTPVVVTSETVLPVAGGLNPANGATDVAVDKTLTFYLQDDGAGIDFTGFSITLSGDQGYNQTFTDLDTAVVQKTGSRKHYVITVNPDVNFSLNETVTVTLSANDHAGNALASPAWAFTTTAVATPQTVTLHPSGLNSMTSSWTTSPIDGNWATYLDTNDGDTTYATLCCTSPSWSFYVDMDDPAGLEGATIQSITFHVYARYRNSPSPGGTPLAANLDIGYKTGAATVWRGNYLTDTSGSYNLVSSTTYTTDSDGGALDLADINNLQISVKRNASGSTQLRVSEVYVEVAYLP